MVHELLEARRKQWRHHVEAVGCSRIEPFLERVGDLLRRARERAMPSASAEPHEQLTHRQFVTACKIGDDEKATLMALHVADRAEIGQWLVEIRFVDLDAQEARKLA